MSYAIWKHNRIGWTPKNLFRAFRAAAATLVRGRVPTLAQRLGYGRHARLLIVHADDLGLAQSVNAAFFNGLTTGLVNSGSVMVPCSGFSEVAAFARSHPEADIGLHLTLTSEGGANPCASVAPPALVPSLVDRQGYLHQNWTQKTRIARADVETELRAQIDKAYASGFRPTHFDSHQFKLQKKTAELFKIYVRLGREYDVPVLVSRKWFANFSYMQPALRPRDIILDNVITIGPKVTLDQWPAFYRNALETLPPGVSEFVIHPAYDDEEMRSLSEGRHEWGAAWRQSDFDFFTSDKFRLLLEKENITLITWREIVKALRQQQTAY
jgi:chitin disaccharide deacetylase